MEKLFRTTDVEVVGNGETLVIRLRSIAQLIALAAALLGAGLLRFLSGVPWSWTGDIAAAEGLARFLLFGSYLLFATVPLAIVAIGIRALRKPIVLHRSPGVLDYRGRMIAFADLAAIEVQTAEIAGQKGVGIIARTPDEVLSLVPRLLPSHQPELERLCHLIQKMVDVGTGAPGPTRELEAWADRQKRRFLALLFLLAGVIWAGLGFLVVRDLIFSSSGGQGGFRVWMLGIWIGFLGLFELAGIPLWEKLTQGPRKQRWLLGLLFFGSYLLASYTW